MSKKIKESGSFTTDEKDVTKSIIDTPKVTKLSKKSVDGVLDNLSDFDIETQNKIKDVFKTLSDSGKVTNGQGGGTSKDTDVMTKLRICFGTDVEKMEDVKYDTTKTGKKLYYILNNNNDKVYPTLYFRSSKQVKKDK